MPDPVIVPRADHRISRREIDPDALRVLYRLHEARHTAYLVGGSVRDLLIGRRPKDFDIGTDAHPQQIKRLFRNCWIIGRRFRLAHIKFGTKVIEVATFRKLVVEPPPGTEPPPTDDSSVVVLTASPEGTTEAPTAAPPGHHPHHENTFGTPEEDAFRRDFTINGLFYDIGSHAVIDYVGGLDDLERRVIRSIGDPRVRFVEDPVRMLRAVVFGARLGFDLDPDVVEAIALHRTLIATASPARLLEEYYKILRSGSAEASFRALDRARLLELVTPELRQGPDEVWESLARLDAYRRRFQTVPASLTSTVLIGALLVPLGVMSRPAAPARRGDPHGDRISFGMLPIARRDLDRLRQLVQLAPRLTDPALPPRVARSLPHRPAFADALTWLDVMYDAPDAVAHWTHAFAERTHAPADDGGHMQAGDASAPGDPVDAQPRRRRRRRRRHRRRGPGSDDGSTGAQ